MSLRPSESFRISLWALKPGGWKTPLIPGAPPSFTAFNVVMKIYQSHRNWFHHCGLSHLKRLRLHTLCADLYHLTSTSSGQSHSHPLCQLVVFVCRMNTEVAKVTAATRMQRLAFLHVSPQDRNPSCFHFKPKMHDVWIPTFRHASPWYVSKCFPN